MASISEDREWERIYLREAEEDWQARQAPKLVRAGRWLKRLSQNPWVNSLLQWTIIASLFFLCISGVEALQAVAFWIVGMWVSLSKTIEIVQYSWRLQGRSKGIAVVFLLPIIGVGWVLLVLLIVISIPLLMGLPYIVQSLMGVPPTEHIPYRGRFPFGG